MPERLAGRAPWAGRRPGGRRPGPAGRGGGGGGGGRVVGRLPPLPEETLVRHRSIGSSGLAASEVGVPVWGLLALDDDEAAGLLHAALDLGVRFFDAGDAEQDGRAERLLGAAVRG